MIVDNAMEECYGEIPEEPVTQPIQDVWRTLCRGSLPKLDSVSSNRRSSCSTSTTSDQSFEAQNLNNVQQTTDIIDNTNKSNNRDSYRSSDESFYSDSPNVGDSFENSLHLDCGVKDGSGHVEDCRSVGYLDSLPSNEKNFMENSLKVGHVHNVIVQQHNGDIGSNDCSEGLSLMECSNAVPNVQKCLNRSGQTVDAGYNNKLQGRACRGFNDRETVNFHRLYRVFISGGLSLPTEDIVVNNHVMRSSLHTSVTSAIEATVKVASRLQAYLWPVVARGHSVIAIGEHASGKTLGYIVPLVSLLLDMWPCIVTEAATRVGAVAVVVCKGWRDVQSVGDTFSQLLDDHGLRVVATWGGLGKESVTQTQKAICKGADILVTTLSFLLRIIGADDESNEKVNFDLLSHCFHLILDDADIILESNATGVKLLLTQWANSRATSQNTHFCQQIIITGSSWTDYIESLTQFLTPLIEPSVIISSPIEAARANKVRSIIHYTASTAMSPYQPLGDVVDLTKEEAALKKILVFVNDSCDAKQLCRLFKCVAIFSRVIHSKMLVWEVQEEMKAWHAAAKGRLLIVTGRSVSLLLERDLRDADILVHVHIPATKEEFRQRFSFLMDNYASGCGGGGPVSHIVVNNADKSLPWYLKECLQHLGTRIPFVINVPFVETVRRSVPLCHLLKAYGSCPLVNLCEWRHTMLLDDLVCKVPDSGIVTVDVVKALNASRYLVRLTEYRESHKSSAVDLSRNYFTLFMALQNFSSNETNLVALTVPQVGKMCLLYESVWVRARILQIHQKMTPKATLFLVDEGNELTVESNKLYALPDEFSVLPQLVLEVYLCKVRPVDNDVDWTHHANIFTENLFNDAGENTKFTGNIVFSLSSTLWISPLVEIVNVEGTNIRKESIRSQLIRLGYGCENKDHIDLLKQQFESIKTTQKDEHSLWLNHWK